MTDPADEVNKGKPSRAHRQVEKVESEYEGQTDNVHTPRKTGPSGNP